MRTNSAAWGCASALVLLLARTAGTEPRAADLLPLVDRVIEFVRAGVAAVSGA